MKEAPEIVKIMREKMLTKSQNGSQDTSHDLASSIELSEIISDKAKSIIDFAPILILAFNEKGNIIFLNREIEKKTGYTREYILNNSIARLFPSLKPRINEFVSELVSERLVLVDFEYPLRAKNGEEIIGSWQSRIIKNDQGEVICVTFFGQDITERKKAEEMLKVKDDAIASSINAIVITDLDGKIVYVNRSFLQMWKFKNETRVLGEPLIKFWKMKGKTVEIMDTLLEKGFWVGELEAERKNGSKFPVQLLANLVTNEANMPTCMMASFIDITERKLAEEEIKIKDNAIDSSINGIVIANNTGNITYVNPSFLKMWRYKDEREVLGKTVVKLWQMKGEYMRIIDTMRTKGGWVGELVAERADGSIFPAQVSSNLVINEKDEIVSIMISFVDITERKKIEEQLRKLDRIKSEFLNVTSHELRTPMSAIKGYVQMVLKQTLGEITEEQKKALNVVLRNTDRLDNLIRDILDISRLESGAMKFIPEETDITKMVNEAIETMKSSADLRNIKIDAELEDNLPLLIIDQERIKQVIINIVNNAIKFSPDGSIINVRAKKKEEEVWFEIQDSGRGIPKEKQKKIFDIFYQVDSGMDRKFGGAGLGLSISRGIVLSHGGKISVESEVGKGSTFHFSLPVKPVEDIEDRFKDIDVFGIKKEGNNLKGGKLYFFRGIGEEENDKNNGS